MTRDPPQPETPAEPASADTAPYRRAILIDHHQGVVQAELADDFHRFGVTLTHDGKAIVDVQGRADRFPWRTCSEAPSALTALIGAPLSPDPTALFRLTDARAQCTHLFELSALAIAEAALGEGETLFEVEVSELAGGGSVARLFRNGAPAMEWRLENSLIVAPEAYAGLKLSDFSSRTIGGMAPELRTMLLIMRRTAGLAVARRFNVDAFRSAAELNRPAECFSLQAANAPRALRMSGSVRLWPERAELAEAVRHR